MGTIHQRKISVIGLGYVGLPVVIAFGKQHPCIGFDINKTRIEELKAGIDVTREITPDELNKANVYFTSTAEELREADFHIISVPTPINAAQQPDLTPLIHASETLGAQLKKGDIVVYESTVYPGTTEEDCVPVLERVSGLTCGVDFHVGYSPERINPGDKERTFTNIMKIVSAQTADALAVVASVYESVVTAGVHAVSSIKVAEAAKVIENTQRDLNIALMNELAIICDHMEIKTSEVLEAAGTKWNFLRFKPGLVGGHCIGVDPYYLTYKAKQLGYQPDVILAGRKINDGMGEYISSLIIKKMTRQGLMVNGSRVAVLGMTFKENCPDIRNSKVLDLIKGLRSWGCNIFVHDPCACAEEVRSEYNIDLVPLAEMSDIDIVVIAVAHDEYAHMSVADFETLANRNTTIYDIKGVIREDDFADSFLRVWRL